MAIALITGSAGLVGSEAARHFAHAGLDIVGVDNDLRSTFFGKEASTGWQRSRLEQELGPAYRHVSADIRDTDAMNGLFRRFGPDIALIVHAAAQPSHDWAARDPRTDFAINAQGTLNLLEATRQHAADAVFIFVSTNKVYGDAVNRLPLVERETRWEIAAGHQYQDGIPEDMPIDRCLHSLFGASKLAADVLVQEYGRYFGLFTACFRCGCVTGPNHSGTRLHGFLAFLLQCAVTGTPYTVLGYGGKQVRDNMHSADLVSAFDQFFQSPRRGAVYNLGGSRHSHCSVVEAIDICERVTGRAVRWTCSSEHRKGDHIWWISDVGKFRQHYPEWRLRYDLPMICTEIHGHNAERWAARFTGPPPSRAR